MVMQKKPNAQQIALKRVDLGYITSL